MGLRENAVLEGMSQLEFLHQLRNARLAHLHFLIKENDRKDRELEIPIGWAREQLSLAERNLAKATLEWNKDMLANESFPDEMEEDKQDIIQEHDFFESWLTE